MLELGEISPPVFKIPSHYGVRIIPNEYS